MPNAPFAIDRQWVTPGEPLLERASQWLLERGAEAPRDTAAQRLCDLSNWLCIVRGGRAGRLLLHELLSAAREAGRGLIPPNVLTQGRMVEHQLDIGKPIAKPVEQSLAWVYVLQDAPHDVLAPLLPEPPEKGDWQAWHRLARTIDSLHEELAGSGVDMEQAAELAERLEQLNEAERWRVLAFLRDRYRAALRTCGLLDPHASRWDTVKQVQASEGTNIAIIGVVELNAIQRAAIRASCAHVVAFVHADDEMQAGFDAFGCVDTAFWSDREITLAESQVIIADRPADQAQAVLQALADLDGRFATDEIVIGLGDETLRDDVERAAMWADISVHPAQGDPLSRLPAARFLAAAAEYLEDPRFAQFASLLRHPDVGRWLKTVLPARKDGHADWLSLLDRYFSDHLQQRFAGEYLGHPQRADAMREVHRRIQELLTPCARTEQPLSQWLPVFIQLLATVYSAGGDAHDDSGARELISALASFASLPGPIEPSLTAPAAIHLMLRELGATAVPAEPRRDAVEMLGWLELSSEPAKALIIAGVNDGKIPAATTPDAFLPDTMRAKLGLPCNATRYARDACLLETMLRSRNKLTLITGRRNTNGEPLTPSRLLLACNERELPKWVQRLCHSAPTSGLPIGTPQPGAVSRFVVPELPSPLEPPAYLAVTDFRLYLACPYRYALQRLVRLDVVTDHVMELDGGKFGTLAHDVLAMLGQSDDMREETDPERLREFLHHELRSRVRQMFGESPLPAVQVQIAQLEQRLRGFAFFQASSRSEGWRIEHCEFKLDDAAALEMPGAAAMPIHGKIDRIDRHERSGAWRIIDYKTGDAGGGPIEAHHGRKKIPDDEMEWIDLQLPLYRYLAARGALRVDGDVELGFVVLPRQSDGVKWIAAPWSAAQLQSAVECAQRVVTAIRAGHFERNLEYVSPFDPFARICQSMVLDSAEDAEDEAEASR